MRILGPNGTTFSAPAQGSRRAGATNFTLPASAEASDVRATHAPMAATNIDGLLALQGIDDPLERRRRAVQRGRGALDLLDGLKIALLTGEPDPARLARLRVAAAGLKAASGEPGLDAVLAEIDLRVEVELAKAGRA